jgi:hypothetical protein
LFLLLLLSSLFSTLSIFFWQSNPPAVTAAIPGLPFLRETLREPGNYPEGFAGAQRFAANRTGKFFAPPAPDLEFAVVFGFQ